MSEELAKRRFWVRMNLRIRRKRSCRNFFCLFWGTTPVFVYRSINSISYDLLISPYILFPPSLVFWLCPVADHWTHTFTRSSSRCTKSKYISGLYQVSEWKVLLKIPSKLCPLDFISAVLACFGIRNRHTSDSVDFAPSRCTRPSIFPLIESRCLLTIAYFHFRSKHSFFRSLVTCIQNHAWVWLAIAK